MIHCFVIEADGYTGERASIISFLESRNCFIEFIKDENDLKKYSVSSPDITICFGDEGYSYISKINERFDDNSNTIYICLRYDEKINSKIFTSHNDNTIVEYFNSDYEVNFQNLSFLINNINKNKASHIYEFNKFLPEFIDNTSIGIWCFRRDEPVPLTDPPEQFIEKTYQSKLRSCNKSFAALFGLSVEDILGKTLTQMKLFFEISDEKILNFGKSDYQKFEIIRKSLHNQQYLSVTVNTIIQDNKLIEAWGTVSDITELQTSIEEQKSSYAQLVSFFQNPEFIASVHDRDGCLQFFNESYNILIHDLTGKHPKIGDYPISLIQDNLIKDKLQMLYNSVVSNQRVFDTIYAKSIDKSYKILMNPILADQKVTGFTQYLLDVSDSIKIQNELQATNIKNQAILKALPDIVFHINKEGILLDIKANNPEKLLFSADYLKMKHIDDLDFSEEFLDSIKRKIADAIKTQEIQIIEYSLIQNEDKCFYEGRIAPAGLDSVLFIIRDITERKQAIDDLKESERKISTLIANIPGIVYRSNYDDSWTKRFISKGCYELTGYKPEEFLYNLNISYNDIIHPDDQQRIRDEIKESAEELDDYILSYRIITKSENIKWVWEQGEIIRDDDNNITGLEGVIIDISPQIEANNELKRSQQNYKLTIDALSEIIHVVDLDLNIVLCNKACRDMAQKITNRTDIVGKNIYDIFPFLPDCVHDQYQYVIKNKIPNHEHESNDVINRVILTETRKIPIFENGQLAKILTIIKDVTTERHIEKIEEALHKISINTTNSPDLDTLLLSIKDILGEITNTKNFYIALYNKESNSFYLPFDDDEKDSDIIPSDKSLTALVFKSGKTTMLTEEMIMDLKNSGQIETHGTPAKVWIGAPLKVDNEIIGVLAVQSYDNPDAYNARDKQIFEITSFEIARAIVIMKAQEKIKNNLLEKEVMLQEIHHRVKNNLQIISSLLHIQSNTIDDENSLKLLKESQNRVRSMAIIHQKLYEDKDLSKVDLSSYIRSLVSNLLRSYNTDSTKIDLDNNVEDIHLSLKTAIPCGLILNEIISNSIKYAFKNRENGKISISITKVNDQTFNMIVRDDGVGLIIKKNKKRKSLGMELIDIFVNQIKGTYTLDTEKGVCYNITFTDPYNKKFVQKIAN